MTIYDVSGAADTVFSRVLSLRRILWLQADDTLGQMFGYRFDIYMNTSYTCILSSKCNKPFNNTSSNLLLPLQSVSQSVFL